MAPSAVSHVTNEYATNETNYFPAGSLCEKGVKCVDNGSMQAKQLIGAALQRHIRSIDPHNCEPGDEDAFFVADLGEVYRQHVRWKKNLGRVTPHYAIKCNPDPMVLRLLAALGAGFDCASKAEIEQVLQIGVQPERIIYAQPCKTKSYLRYTGKQGVRQMTFDNEDELYKVKELCPDAELFLRILTDDSASLCRLSQKFGASMETVPALLGLIKELDLNLAGVAFHVGSGATDPHAFVTAVRDARDALDQASTLGLRPHTLDVGGGFVSETFEDTASVLSAALDAYVPAHIRVIAEPGRYYTSAAFTLACNVIARRTVPNRDGAGRSGYMLYLNDGVYGNFSSIIFDHQHPVPRILSTRHRPDAFEFGLASDDHPPPPSLQHHHSHQSNMSTESLTDSGYTSADESSSTLHAPISVHHTADAVQQIPYSIWGPTCDGIDLIAASWHSPETVEVGDWLYFADMGAYTKCSATRFNGFTDRHETIYVCSEAGASAVLGDLGNA